MGPVKMVSECENLAWKVIIHLELHHILESSHRVGFLHIGHTGNKTLLCAVGILVILLNGERRWIYYRCVTIDQGPTSDEA